MAPSQQLAERIGQRRFFHTVDLGGGLVTTGDSPESEIIAGTIPDVAGKSVLDIGAWDGKYSFEAERAGASRVVALDHYVWRLDATARQAYYDRCVAEGVLPDPDMIDRGFFVDDGLPGKGGFDMIHEYLDSKVEAVVGDFATMDVSTLGTFDVVFYFGVLYHMVNPIDSLKRLRQVTDGVAVVETAGTFVPGHPDAALTEFFAGDELHADYGNWFAPNKPALRGMLRAAGFRTVDGIDSTPVPDLPKLKRRDPPHRPQYCRLVAHAHV